MLSPTPTKRRRVRSRPCCESGHEFGPWWACGCGLRNAAHADRWPGGCCVFEFRTCQRCPQTEERHLAETTAATCTPQPGGPSATTTRRAGSPNHLMSSEEISMVEPSSALVGGASWNR